MSPSDLLKFIDPIRKRIMNMFSRGVVLEINDSAGIQRVKASLYADEIQSKLERIQNYGFTSNPQKGSEAIVLFHSGNRDHGVVLAIDDRRFRVKNLQEGEVAFYSDEGDTIIFKRGNKMEITTKELTVNAADKVNVVTQLANIEAPSVTIVASESVMMTTPVLNVSGLVNCAGIGAGAPAEAGKAIVNGSVEATGTVTSQADVIDSKGSMDEMRTKYNAHKHNALDPLPNPNM